MRWPGVANTRLRTWIEAKLLVFAAFLLDRNVQRAMVISRRDNNWLFEVVQELRSVAKPVQSKYEA